MTYPESFHLDADEWRAHGAGVVDLVEETASATRGAHFDEPVTGLLVSTAKSAWEGFAQSHQNAHHALLGRTTNTGNALTSAANETQGQDEDSGNDIHAAINW
jgi:hypothetical protein